MEERKFEDTRKLLEIEINNKKAVKAVKWRIKTKICTGFIASSIYGIVLGFLAFPFSIGLGVDFGIAFIIFWIFLGFPIAFGIL